ncbi:MAG: aminotransferase class I/II-fold pyridoxal phosphate-dependent enzyme [Ferruginibacter sp.]
MKDFNRRNFIRLSGLSALPLIYSGLPEVVSAQLPAQTSTLNGSFSENERVWFINDGPMYKPTEYIRKLSEIDSKNKITRDSYGQGGTVEEMEKLFISITGKEAAVYMPSGTLANQLALSELSGGNTKIYVQETSHVFRDEADAAQKVFNKRLIPLAKGEAYFSAEDLKNSIKYYDEGEVFKSGSAGVVSVENPVRRNNGAFVPYEELKKIAEQCKQAGYKLHLDGARIYMAAAATGILVGDYAALFDTVYISLYKYLGAGGGAVLCGSKELICKMQHNIKIHGGSVYTSWANAAMAVHHLAGIDERLKKVWNRSTELFKDLNASGKVSVSPVEKNNTNMFYLKFEKGINNKKVIADLRENYFINLQSSNSEGVTRMTINETLLLQENDRIFDSFMKAIKGAGGS